MALTITMTLPDEIEEQLRQEAAMQQQSVEEFVLAILLNSLHVQDFFPTPEQVVAKIKAIGPNPQNIIPPQGSLADYLRNAPDDPNFDLAAWNEEWAAIEAEMKAITRANDIAEGRGRLYE